MGSERVGTVTEMMARKHTVREHDDEHTMPPLVNSHSHTHIHTVTTIKIHHTSLPMTQYRGSRRDSGIGLRRGFQPEQGCDGGHDGGGTRILNISAGSLVLKHGCRTDIDAHVTGHCDRATVGPNRKNVSCTTGRGHGQPAAVGREGDRRNYRRGQATENSIHFASDNLLHWNGVGY